MSANVNRRTFLFGSAGLGAAAFLTSTGRARAGDKVRVGMIGCGGQGEFSWSQLGNLADDVEFRVLCDVDLARTANAAKRFPGAEVSIILIAGENAGVLEVWRGPSEIRLVNVEIAARFRGSGAGSTLVRGLLSEGAAGRLPVVLNVREDNHGAQRLYRRLGFLAESRSNGYVAMRAAPKNR